jgi:cysteinyl-tRNA synthetase
MDQTVTSLNRLYTARDRLFDTAVDETADDSSVASALDGFRDRFNEAMDDDLNTADAIGVLFDFARWINIFATDAHTKAAIEAVKTRYAELNGVLGLVVKEKKEDFPEEALALLEARKEAKAAKDWAKADAIRDELKSMGYAVEDTKDGAKLKKL